MRSCNAGKQTLEISGASAGGELEPELVQLHDRAREAFANRTWTPASKSGTGASAGSSSNETARLERRRSIELKKHFEEVK
jgi:hypothetical protein